MHSIEFKIRCNSCWDGDYLYLLPVIVNEPVYVKDREKSNARIERNNPTMIKRSSVDIIDIFSEGYLERFAKSVNEYYPPNNKTKKSTN